MNDSSRTDSNSHTGRCRGVTRRGFLGAGMAVGVLSAQPALLGATDASTAAPADALLGLDATGWATLVKSGEVSALELVDAAISRIERLNPIINAVAATNFELARERAQGLRGRGVFQGVPYLIKDLTDTADIATQRGSRMFKGFLPDADHESVVAVEEAGMVVLGKTTTPEFGLIATTETLLSGPTSNPWGLDRSPGGSSGGAGAAVASGMVPVASGSDGGGSIRIPASQCGVFGLKPSMGLPLASATTLPDGISVRGCLSRSVRDTAVMLTVCSRPGRVQLVREPVNRPLRVGLIVNDHFGHRPHPDVVAAVESTARLMESLGHHVDTHAFSFDGAEMMDHFMSFWTQGPKEIRDSALNRGLDPQAVLEPWTLGLAAMGDERTPDKVAAATEYLSGLGRNPAMFGSFDMLLCPVLSQPPILTGEQAPTLPFAPLYEDVLNYVSYTPLANVTGACAMSVPLSWSASGLPIGSQFVAPPGGDELLLQLAYQLEEARPWADRWAPNSARFI